ncbi:MAG: phosphoribosylformylglycinamidine synthase [Gammaproteobacteria bacterium]|nr:phosphoribosylformylglycinamidine synthase [Gammaproteobacteria bacterium]
MRPLVWPGGAALSGFRLEKLLADVRARLPAITGVSARLVHFIDLAAPLGEPEARTLADLLDDGSPAADDLPGTVLVVVPRAGTVSPWSSKATDIARSSGLDAVRRVERGIRYSFAGPALQPDEVAGLAPLLHDRMTQAVLAGTLGDGALASALFATAEPRPLRRVPLLAEGVAALRRADADLGLALSPDEMEYLARKFREEGRDPTDAELMMFAQANSEHCRHKIFNARWIIDGSEQPHSLFELIRSTHAVNPHGVLSAYKDNAAVMAGGVAGHLHADPATGRYVSTVAPIHTLMKVETHNHPTAISPFPGAATGSGGELRDEGATGRGGRPKAGLTGFTVSNLALPGWEQPWEAEAVGRPGRIASALEIMLDGPIGAAAFNNEFGRPNIAGYFRSFEQPDRHQPGRARGYHKPIMLAGGLGAISAADVEKAVPPAGTLVIVIGGPGMLIGLGGGAASSVGSGVSSADLDFASVQRGNPEIQRRAQQVIEACRAAGTLGGRGNPILMIHDVGAGGLSNAVPELVDHAGGGGRFELRSIPTADRSMSPLEIWCNESQERYVLALDPADLDWFDAVCARERCPYAVLGRLDGTGRLLVSDRLLGGEPVDMPLATLLGKPPRMVREITRRPAGIPGLDLAGVTLAEAALRVLRLPTVADKSFLIHIGDRTVGGLVARDQLVGPWQVPVSDVGVTALGFDSLAGEAMALGERPPVAVLDAPASGRLAVGEAITNIAAADVRELAEVRLSANWMAAAGAPGEDERLFDTVTAVAAMCRELRIAIPVGKDSLSMQTRWEATDGPRAVVAPVSLVVTAFAPVADVRRTLTPVLDRSAGTSLWLVDLGGGRNRLGGSCLAQCYGLSGGEPPDVDDVPALGRFFAAIRELRDAGLLLAYHDRSDGGLFVTLSEMAFAGHAGLDVALEGRTPEQRLAELFAEEPGAVLQVRDADAGAVAAVIGRHGLATCFRRVGRVVAGDAIRITAGDEVVGSWPRPLLHGAWSELSFRMQALRDNPATAAEEQESRVDPADPGLAPLLCFDPAEDPAAPLVRRARRRPEVAILREQGVNSQLEMAAAFGRAGFDAVDVHMTDLLSGRRTLDGFAGLAVCGGFSYGDVLGAGGGWAKSILHNARARDAFAAFFARPDTFTLGVCNGCQMLSVLAALIPGADHWPRFRRNRSEQFEARLSLVEVLPSRSVLLEGMAGSRLLIATSHGEGRAAFGPGHREACQQASQLALRYVDNQGRPAERYPANPNGSPGGIAGLCSADGRVTILMPHPERVHRTVQHSWHPAGWGADGTDDGPWLRLFRNARRFAG